MPPKRVVANAQAITVPTQVLISGADYVVRRKPQQQFFERLGSQRKELHLLPGFFIMTPWESSTGPTR